MDFAAVGARQEMLESYVKRLEDLEKLAMSFKGVSKSYAIQAGREVRIMVEGKLINDDQSFVLCKDIAKKIGVTEKTLKELNPELRYKILPRDKYPLKVPLNKGHELLARLHEIPVSSVPRPAYVYHRVRPGETLSTIAQRYRTSVRRIARANNITKTNYIVAGKKIKIPQRGTAVYASSKNVQSVRAFSAHENSPAFIEFGKQLNSGL